MYDRVIVKTVIFIVSQGPAGESGSTGEAGVPGKKVNIIVYL